MIFLEPLSDAPDALLVIVVLFLDFQRVECDNTTSFVF
jgi:hypothetical protein